MNNNTYILVWRKIKETSFYKKPNCAHLAQHLIREVNWKDGVETFSGNKITIKRGQLLTGRFSLSKETGLSAQKLRTALDVLKKAGFLTSESTNQFTIITVCKYNEYQVIAKAEQPANQQTDNKRITNEQQTDNKRITTIEVIKEVKECNNTTVARDYFYQSYEKHIGRKYVADFGKDGKIFKDMVSVLDIEVIKKKIDCFFNSKDHFIIKAGYTIGVFKSVINKLEYKEAVW